MKFALENGVQAISQSFVENAADVDAARKAAAEMGYQPFIIAKIERVSALANIEEILRAADGIMVARGDLGVEIPIEKIAIVQKELISQANLLGKPVITATQMLESMVEHFRPTRAEVTDVANAILDGTDCVMLSEESAMGKFPVEAVRMLAAIAVETEPYQVYNLNPVVAMAHLPPISAASRLSVSVSTHLLSAYPVEPKPLPSTDLGEISSKPTAGIRFNHVQKPMGSAGIDGDAHMMDLIAINVQQTVSQLMPIAILVPTVTGHTARMVSRFKLPIWIAAVSAHEATCHGLQFSYGVSPVHVPEPPLDWNKFANQWAQEEGLPNGVMALTEGPSLQNPEKNPRLEIIRIKHE
jgi:pyruvate kinase